MWWTLVLRKTNSLMIEYVLSNINCFLSWPSQPLYFRTKRNAAVFSWPQCPAREVGQSLGHRSTDHAIVMLGGVWFCRCLYTCYNPLIFEQTLISLFTTTIREVKWQLLDLLCGLRPWVCLVNSEMVVSVEWWILACLPVSKSLHSSCALTKYLGSLQWGSFRTRYSNRVDFNAHISPHRTLLEITINRYTLLSRFNHCVHLSCLIISCSGIQGLNHWTDTR